MDIGMKINQLRKLSGMTQEQLAEKLNVSRQTISKWETGTTSPDLESVVRISKIFQVSLNELLLDGEPAAPGEKLTLEDLVKMNLYNRRMTLLLISGLIFLMVSVMTAVFVTAIRSTTVSTQYMLYRYIAVGEYAYAPVDYGKLFLPSISAGIVGAVLCLCYAVGIKTGGKLRIGKPGKRLAVTLAGIGAVLAVVIAAVQLFAARSEENPYELYTATVAGLEDDEQFAYVEINAELPVLLVTDMTYNNRDGNQAGLFCDVYYAVSGEVRKLGKVESFGTAYPIAYDQTGVYGADGHGVWRFVIDEKDGTLKLAEVIRESFDENGNAAYFRETDGNTVEVTEQEYLKAWENYGNALVVSFRYGAS